MPIEAKINWMGRKRIKGLGQPYHICVSRSRQAEIAKFRPDVVTCSDQQDCGGSGAGDGEGGVVSTIKALVICGPECEQKAELLKMIQRRFPGKAHPPRKSSSRPCTRMSTNKRRKKGQSTIDGGPTIMAIPNTASLFPNLNSKPTCLRLRLNSSTGALLVLSQMCFSRCHAKLTTL